MSAQQASALSKYLSGAACAAVFAITYNKGLSNKEELRRAVTDETRSAIISRLESTGDPIDYEAAERVKQIVAEFKKLEEQE